MSYKLYLLGVGDGGVVFTPLVGFGEEYEDNHGQDGPLLSCRLYTDLEAAGIAALELEESGVYVLEMGIRLVLTSFLANIRGTGVGVVMLDDIEAFPISERGVDYLRSVSESSPEMLINQGDHFLDEEDGIHSLCDAILNKCGVEEHEYESLMEDAGHAWSSFTEEEEEDVEHFLVKVHANRRKTGPVTAHNEDYSLSVLVNDEDTSRKVHDALGSLRSGFFWAKVGKDKRLVIDTSKMVDRQMW